MRDNDARKIISASLAGEIRPLPGKNVLVALLVGFLACSWSLVTCAADGPTNPAARANSDAPRTARPSRTEPAAYSIRGTIVDDKGSPLSNITVAAVEGMGRTPTF